MSSIDQRIVEMQFDNRQFESGVKTTISTLDRLKQKLNFGKSAQSLDDLSKASKRFSLDGLASSVEYIASKFSFMGVMGVTAMQRISNAAITTGKRLVSALTIDPIRSGLSEYETQIGAIQTILSNTRSKGTTLDQVNNALDELNAYADKTIYNFTEMTRNIGTFTAAGVDLDTSVAAIKGIANLAAVSGSTSVQAATAMYQLSQALASGTIRLMDWNSVVNAGMGGDVLQSALKETARVHGIAIDQMIEEQGSFRETLQKGWLTSEIMLETLQKFTGDLSKEQILAMGYTAEQAEEIIALGKDANDAATKVKTFTQLIDTLKEALGSGWTQTWEFIIGDFEEARTLWTDVSDAIGEVINNTAEARNSMVKAWKEAGGRDDLIEGLTDIFGALWNIITAVGDAMDDIFPPATVDTLLNISSGVKEFGDNLQRLFGIIGQAKVFTGEDITTTETVGGVDFFGDSLSRGARNDAVKKLQQYLKDAGYDLGNAGVDGIFGPMTEAALKEFQESAGVVIDGVYSEETHNALMDTLGLGPKEITTVEKGRKTINYFSSALQRLRNIAEGAFAVLHIAWQGIQFVGNIIGHVLKLLTPVGDAILTVAEGIAGCFVNLDKWLEESGLFGDWLDSIVEFLRPVGDWFESVGQSIKNFFGFGEEVDEANGEIKTFATLWNKIKKSVSNLAVWDKLADAWQALKNAFAEISPVIQEYWNTAKEWIGEKFGDLLDWIVEKVPEAAEKIGEFFTKIVEWAKPGIQKIPELFAKIGNAFRGLFDSVDEDGNRVPGVISRIGSFFAGLYEQVKNSKWVQSAITNVSNFLSRAWEKIKVVVSDISAWVSELFSGGDGSSEGAKAGESIKQTLEPVISVFDWVKQAWVDHILPVIQSVVGWMSQYLGDIGPGGLIALLLGVIGVIKAAKMISSIIGVVTSFGSLTASVKDLADTAKKGLKDFLDGKDSILDIAKAIALMVAAIYVLGSMDSNVFKRGALALGGIMLALLAFQKLSSMKGIENAANNIKGIGGSIRSIAFALLVMSGAVKLLSDLNLGELLAGLGGLAGVMGLLVAFIYAMNVIGEGKIKIKIKGFFSLAVAIGVLIGIMKLINTFTFGEFVGGLLGLISVMGVLVVAINAMSSLSGGVKINMRGFFSLALAIAVLVGVMKLITSVLKDVGEYLLGLAGIAGVMAALAGFGKLISGIDISLKSAASLLILSAVVGILAAIMIVIGQLSWDMLAKGIAGLIGVVGSLAIFAIALSKMGSGIKLGQTVILVLSFVAVIAAFGLLMNAIKDVDPSVMISFAASLGVSLAALMASLKIASGMGVGMMAKGAAGIGVAVSIILGIGTALVAALGALDQLLGGRLTGWLESGGKVLEAFGKAIGALVGGFVSGFIGPVGEALESLSNGLEGLGSNDNLDEDIDKAIEAVKSIGEFITTIQDMNVEREWGIMGFGFGFKMESKATSLMNQIEAFGDAIGSVGTALQGLEGLDSADIQFAIDAANSVSGFITSIEGMDGVQVNPGMFQKFFGGDNETNSLLDQIEKFGESLQSVTDAITVCKGNSITDDDSKNIVNIATDITDFIATVRENYPENGIPEDLFIPYYNELMSQIETFADSMGSVKSGIAGIAHGENALTDEDIDTAIEAVEQITPWITELDKKLNGLDNVKLSSGWFEELFNGENTTTSLFDQIENFGTSIGNVKTNLAGIDELDDDDIKKATNAAQSITDFITGVIGSEEFRNASSYVTSNGNDAFTAIEDLFGRFKTFSETMSTVATGLSGMGGSSFDADNNAAIGVAEELAIFFAETLPSKIKNMEDAKGTLEEWLTGESGTDAFLTRINEFSTSMSEIIGAFNGMSGTTLKTDMGDATDAIDDIVEMLVNMGSPENSEALNRLIGTNGMTLPEAVYGYVTGLGNAIDVVNTTVENVNFDNIDKISEFLNSVSGLVTRSEGFASMMDTFGSLQSTMSGEGENAIDTSTWLTGLNSEDVITRLTDFTTAVNGALTTNTETLSAQVDAFTSAGSELASAVSGGLGSNVDTTGVSTLCGALISAIRGYKSQFYSAGWYLSSGVAQGISGGGGIVRDAARRIISNALSAMRAAADVHSPSKETEKIARFMDMGLANGLNGYSKVVSRAAEGVAGEAIDSTRSTFANLSTVLSEDMDTTPVIRPVMDMSNISAGARTINGIFSGGRTLSVGVTAAKAQAASAAMRESRRRQNGSNDAASLISNANDSSVNLTGNNFYIRSDQDVRALASEIAALTRQQQRSYGAAY